MKTKSANIISLIAITFAWAATYYQGIVTAVDVWTVSEIFNHCYLVIPGALYLIFQKRAELKQTPIKPNYWLVAPLAGTLILYTFGSVGDIRLFMHAATFTSLPLLIWLVIGNKAAKQIAFPLYFMLFAIPVGEQLIPYLQELTTNLAVPLIELSGVPIYRNGLYLDIPQGRFLVAEACSGISFLIASIMFGNLYAYISFKNLPKQLLFVLISFVVPIAANAIRVFGIVLTAHLTDMEYAAGADHIIYGGVFYAIVLFLLIFIGEKFRDKDLGQNISEEIEPIVANKNTKLWPVSSVIFAMFIMQVAWVENIESTAVTLEDEQQLISVQHLSRVVQKKKVTQWQPSFTQASEIQQGVLLFQNTSSIDYFIAAYGNSGKGELISALNKLYDAKRWTLIGTKKVEIKGSIKQAKITKLVSPLGEQRIIIHWYQVSDNFFTSAIKTKLFQTTNLLLGQAGNSALVAFSLQTSSNSEHLEQNLLTFVESNGEKLDKIVLSK